MTTQNAVPRPRKGEPPGDFIRRLRKEQGLSLFLLGRATSIDPQTLRRCEVLSQITPRSAERIAAALGCRAQDLKPADYRGQSPKTRRVQP